MVDIKNIRTFVVIGAGTMGREIAQVALMAGFE
ncbi:MAG: 3-hydroxyacyl-CoA dehydrogenase NAD-binding domain-containing protein, partial [Promethearchaeota archaeon]